MDLAQKVQEYLNTNSLNGKELNNTGKFVTKIDDNGDESITYWDISIAQPSDADLTAAESVVNQLIADAKLEALKIERNKKLAETDYWMFSDTSTATQAQLDYRQALRDITNTYTSLDDVVWPTKP